MIERTKQPVIVEAELVYLLQSFSQDELGNVLARISLCEGVDTKRALSTVPAVAEMLREVVSYDCYLNNNCELPWALHYLNPRRYRTVHVHNELLRSAATRFRISVDKQLSRENGRCLVLALVDRHGLRDHSLATAEKLLVENYLTLTPLPPCDLKFDSLQAIANMHRRRVDELKFSFSLLADIGLYLAWIAYKRAITLSAEHVGG